MNLFDTTQLGLERAIHGSAVRHAALAQNLANANTPGYRRKDVDFQSALGAAMSRGSESVEATEFQAQTDGDAPMRADGNSVDADVEAANLSQNGLTYEALVSAARARIDIIKAAMGQA